MSLTKHTWPITPTVLHVPGHRHRHRQPLCKQRDGGRSALFFLLGVFYKLRITELTFLEQAMMALRTHIVILVAAALYIVLLDASRILRRTGYRGKEGIGTAQVKNHLRSLR